MGDDLSITYQDLLESVGFFAAHGSDSTAWSSDQLKQIDRIVQAGYRQFLYPPAIPGVEAGHQWTFLRPTATIVTVADGSENDLPVDFGRFCSNLSYEPVEYTPSIVIVPMAIVQARRQTSSFTGRPRIAATQIKAMDGQAPQTHEVSWWPTPDKAYTLSYQYEAYAGRLSDSRPYPLGGAKMAGLIEQSCLASAESILNDERGIQQESFMAQLAAAIAQDKKSGARFFGSMGQPQEVEVLRRRHEYPYPISYKGIDL